MTAKSGISELMPSYFRMKNVDVIPNKAKETAKRVYPELTYGDSGNLPDYFKGYM